MATIHNLGFPRIGAKRELKFALEDYWKGKQDEQSLEATAAELRAAHWQRQNQLDFTPVGDFAFYDQVLETSFLLGHIPERVSKLEGSELDSYFRVARGRSPVDQAQNVVFAGEMTKWFDTNYHYIVPEFNQNDTFSLNADRLLNQIKQAKSQGVNVKPVIIGPITYLWLGKSKDGSDKLAQLDKLIPIYQQLLAKLADAGTDWVQIDEAALVTELDNDWQQAYKTAYKALATDAVNILLTTYFGQLKDNLSLVEQLPVQGIHLDATRAKEEIQALVEKLKPEQVLSLGVIDGRNIWKADLNQIIADITPVHKQLGDRLWLAPSCSLLHVPVDLNSEQNIDGEVQNWLAFAQQKLEELAILGKAINQGKQSVAGELANNAEAIQLRSQSTRVHNPQVKQAVAAIDSTLGDRDSDYPARAAVQADKLKLPPFPTTSIGSFPQTKAIRAARRLFKKGDLPEADYKAKMKAEVELCVREQEALDIDVLVHGEPERNDMVEYFGEQLEGYIFSQFGWVQSYGSRCVKPPIIFGDISRPQAMTVEWSQYAKSLTNKPMKGMLTGPVTILNWSFVRDDQPRSVTCYQLALAIREEVLDLEQAGIDVIQIDEPALREGLPLRQSQWQDYLNWAVETFRVSANGVKDSTQIHTHMCYSEFNDIMPAIADLDADVITIETSRSDMELLDVFEDFNYPNEIGPGVYDIHSPNIPATYSMVNLMKKAAERIPAQRLWVNPDCGLKTRNWEEVRPALQNMVAAAKQLRQA